MNKNDKIRYLITLGTVIMLCHGFLQMHYSSDTFVLWDLGYMNYPQQYFLLDGRLISAAVCFLAGLLQLPLEVYIIGMTAIGVVFVSLAVFTTSNILISIIKPVNNLSICYITAISFVLILNQFSLEFLLFPESAVMCFGLYMIVVAVKLSLGYSKYKYIKIGAVLLIATISYQGLLNIFPLLLLIMYIIKQISHSDSKKFSYKKAITNVAILAVVTIAVLLISVAVVEIGLYVLDSSQDRSNQLATAEDFAKRVETIIAYVDEIWNKTISMLPPYLNYIVILVSTVFLLFLKAKPRIIAQYFFIIAVALIICIAPMFIYNTGPVGRVNVPIAMVWGASLAIIYAQSCISTKKSIKNWVEYFIIASFMLNGVFILLNIAEHNAANKIDENIGKTINYKIESYEEQTGIAVTKMGYIYDSSPQQYAVGIRPLGSLTERKFAVRWSIYEAMNFYCDRKFERIFVTDVLAQNFDVFTEDQIFFDDDTVYLIVY